MSDNQERNDEVETGVPIPKYQCNFVNLLETLIIIYIKVLSVVGVRKLTQSQ